MNDVLRELREFAKQNENRPTPELDKLETYLKDRKIHYERIDVEPTGVHTIDKHQIIVYNKEFNRIWDAICHYGSYGYEQGLLEIYGILVPKGEVEGWLTAEQVIEKWEELCKRLERGEGINGGQ